MKKYIFKILLFLAVLALPFIAWFSFIMTNYGNFAGSSIPGTMRYKIRLIEETPSPKIILVGGSSSPYGTVCQDFEDEFNMPCINIGATAYLGLEYYINVLERYQQEGDIVIIAPEHMLLTGKSVDYETVWMAVENDFKSIKSIPINYAKGMFLSFHNYSKTRINENLDLNYTRHNDFGEKGDVVAYRETLLESGYNKNEIVRLNKDNVYQYSLYMLNNYYKNAKSKGVNVFFAFAPLNNLAVQSTAEENKEFENTIINKLDISVILDLDTSIMNYEYFYDSNNHLTTAGAKINTENLIKGLKPYID